MEDHDHAEADPDPGTDGAGSAGSATAAGRPKHIHPYICHLTPNPAPGMLVLQLVTSSLT